MTCKTINCQLTHRFLTPKQKQLITILIKFRSNTSETRLFKVVVFSAIQIFDENRMKKKEMELTDGVEKNKETHSMHRVK